MTACCRWCIRTAWCPRRICTTLPLVEPVYPLTEGLSLNVVRKAAEAALLKMPVLPEWQDDAWLQQQDWPASAQRCRRCIIRPTPVQSRPKRRPGRGSPMTNCSPASWRSRWCARTRSASPGGRAAATDGCAAKIVARAALFADVLAGTRDRGDQRRPRQARTHAAPAAGRRRLRQDRGGAARRRDRGRGRAAGRPDGADRDPRAPASQDHGAARRSRRAAARDPHRPRTRQGARRDSGAACGRRARSPGRHPCAVPGRGRVPRSRARRSSTSSIASACTSASRSPARARPWTCWC